MRVSIIGSGNVATHIAKALRNANVTLLNIWSYNLENAQILANKVDAVAVAEIAQINTEDSDIVLISVKDDAIATVASQLVNYSGLIAHTSGAVTIDALSNHKNYGVFYPLQTFSKHKELDFSNVPLCLEANDTSNLDSLKHLAKLISKNFYEVDSEQRKTLHLAAVFACNFPNYLYGVAQQLLAQNHLDFDIIKPLITETANKIQTALPMEVQTGPAVRNDEQTLKKHEGMLQEHPEWLTIYKLLSEQIKKG
ncbi:Pyrroline-5-carboxylate reductase [compost metagenome]